MLTGAQLRAARALVRMKQVDLAERAGIALATVQRLEGQDGGLSAHSGTLTALQEALEAAGVAFLPGGEAGGPGVRLAGS